MEAGNIKKKSKWVYTPKRAEALVRRNLTSKPGPNHPFRRSAVASVQMRGIVSDESTKQHYIEEAQKRAAQYAKEGTPQ
jgi:glycerol-3-phosphate O-acyltransferase